MSLEDFKKIEESNFELDDEKDNIENIDYKSIQYYCSHLDELLDIVNENYSNYVNLKLKYEFKKDQYQVSLNWNEENALREADNLPKITNQNQRDSVINLKLKPLYEKMRYFEMKYRFYNKIFDFINWNYELLVNFENDDEIEEN